MNDFNHYLETMEEIGFVDSSFYSIVYVTGLPQVHPSEIVVFETGDLGQVITLTSGFVEILLLTNAELRVGTKVVRTGKNFEVPVGEELFGRVISPLGAAYDRGKAITPLRTRPVDTEPPRILVRAQVEKFLETGVTLVDLVVPLGRGQRELVIGDRKTGKTEFVLQTILTQASYGTICIYAVIGQKQIDIQKLSEFFQNNKIAKSTIIVASSSSDPSGLIYLTPYTAMAIAEHFKDQGKDVLLILDDLTSHARCYREISLLAKRFPKWSSYPGDIFYLHARLLERAGNFKNGSITALPLAESILGDLSGYIQTNLMAMTDGHIFFDIELYNQGKRPAVNPFLSVSRVGRQTQTPFLKDVGQEVSIFLVNYERMKQFLHFGAEVGENARKILALGERLDIFFNQGAGKTIPITANVILLTALWAGIWNDTRKEDLKREMESIVLGYQTDSNYKKQIDDLVASSKIFPDLVNYIRRSPEIIMDKLRRAR